MCAELLQAQQGELVLLSACEKRDLQEPVCTTKHTRQLDHAAVPFCVCIISKITISIYAELIKVI